MKNEEISKVGLIAYIVGLVILFVGAILILTNKSSTNPDRIKLFAYMLIGYAGFFIISKFKIIFRKKRKEKKKGKKNSKIIKLLAKHFMVIVILIQLVNLGIAFMLFSSNLSNILGIITYTFMVIGIDFLLCFIGIILVLKKNKKVLFKLLNKLVNKKKSGNI